MRNESSIDRELVKQVLSGDKEAFDVLVLKYQQKILSVIRQYLDDQSLAMDVAQETFIHAYRALPTFRAESSFYTWLYRIAVNTTKNHLKGLSRRPPASDIDIKDALNLGKIQCDIYSNPDFLLHQGEMRDAIMNAVNLLPEDLRTSIILREMVGLSYDEIANVMSCPVGTVRSRIFRARIAMDEHLKPLYRQSE